MSVRETLRFAGVGLLLLGSLAAGTAEAAPVERARASLVANVKAVKPGETFRVGVLVELAPGWHVYWKNPGESGIATTVAWKGPVAPVEYPAPERLDLDGGIVSYGYEGKVLLLATATAPADAAPATTLTIGASVSWFVCKKLCVPGSAELTLDLPIGAASTPANEGLFSEWEARLPAASSPDVLGVETTGTLSKAAAPAPFETVIRWQAPVSGVQVFPAPEDALLVSDVNVANKTTESRVTWKAAVMGGSTLTQKALEAVVSFERGGVKKSVRLLLPLGRQEPK
jgi:thiol:disulfide interchange protein DsbD